LAEFLGGTDPTDPDTDAFLQVIDRNRCLFLPNTSGARTAEEAVRIAELGRALGQTNWLKLEVTPDPNHLLPDPIETLKAAEQLVKAGFVVLPYMPADPLLAKRLEACGCATLMPLGSLIGSNQGLRMADMIGLIIAQSGVPVVVDAGIGSPSDAAKAMEMGADAVLVNTAIATANHPVPMAAAFKAGVAAGRQAYLAGLSHRVPAANASSPLTGFLHV
jgi:thiazole synthase